MHQALLKALLAIQQWPKRLSSSPAGVNVLVEDQTESRL